VVVTHPFHPLLGHEFEQVDRRQTWGEDRVYFHDEYGELKRLPAAWTSAAQVDAFVVISAGRSHFRVEDLLELASLIARAAEAQAPSGRKGRRGRLSRKRCR
jgi:hypothetical protein